MILAGIHLSGGISLGDLLVAVGTFLLAVFTGYLALVTSRLDKRTAERERLGQERRVRGVARLIDGELETVQRAVEQAEGSGSLLLTTEMSHTAWDRDGALIVETLPLNEAIEMIRAFDKLKAWENVLAQLRAPLPIGASLPTARANRGRDRPRRPAEGRWQSTREPSCARVPQSVRPSPNRGRRGERRARLKRL